MATNGTVDQGHIKELAALINKSVQTVLTEYASENKTIPSLDVTDASQTLINRPILEAVRILESACAQLCATVAPAEHIMVNRAFEMINPASLHVALTARVAEQLRDGPKPVSEIAKTAGMDADKLGRVLRNLTAKHCFREVSRNVYANNKLSVCLLPEDATSGIIRRFVDETYLAFSKLSEVMSDPEWAYSTAKNQTAFVRAHGQTVFDRARGDPVRSARYTHAMEGWTKVNGGADVAVYLYPWDEVPPNAIFCDVGGSTGEVCLALIQAKPHLRTIVQDLPKAIDQANAVWQNALPEALESKRAQLIPMDFFAQSPVEGCDFYYLKHVLHDWPDAECVTILSNIRKAMKDGKGKVLIHEFIIMHATTDTVNIDAGQKAPFPLLPNYGVGTQKKYYQDLNMLALFNGRERTVDDFASLAEKSGLKFSRLWEGDHTGIVELVAA